MKTLLFILIYLIPGVLISQSTLEGIVKFPDTYGAKDLWCDDAFLNYTPVENIKIDYLNLNDSSTDADTTDSSGKFSFSSDNGMINLIPSENDGTTYSHWLNGVDVEDFNRLGDHLSVFGNFIKCPLSRIAADVDNDGDIDASDKLLVRHLILDTIQSFPDVENWRFVADAYVNFNDNHPDPFFISHFWSSELPSVNGNNYPFDAVLHFNDSTYTYNGSLSWMNELHEWPFYSNIPCGDVGWGFFLIKSGDVNFDADVSSFPIPPSMASPPIQKMFSQSEYPPLAGNSLLPIFQFYQITVRVVGGQSFQAYQTAIDFPADLFEIIEILPGADLVGQDVELDFNIIQTPQFGELRNLWGVDYDQHPEGIIGDGLPKELFSFIIQTQFEVPINELLNLFQVDEFGLPVKFIYDNKVIPSMQIIMTAEAIN